VAKDPAQGTAVSRGAGHNGPVRVSAKADYGIRAVVELASVADDLPAKGEQLAGAQGIPLRFLLNILQDLKRAGIVESHRGAEGGYRLARPPDTVPLADIIRAVEGPLAQVGDARPEDLHYTGPAEALSEVWIAVRANLRAVLEVVTVADVTEGSLPKTVRDLVRDPEAWVSH
jgi:Rrf2 family protein